MVWRFLKHYGMSKATDVLDEFAAAVVEFDPEVASKAQIEMMEAELHKLEQLKPEIEREEQEDHEVEAWRAELRRSFEELGQKLRRARGELKSARRQMDMARLRNERAQEQDRRAREAAGITSSISALSVALDSMNRQTAKLRAETSTMQLKAGLYQTEQLESDSNIAAALGAARGRSGDARSLSDRLAALDGRPAAPHLSAAE